MKRYRSHKIVEAAQIVRFTLEPPTVTVEAAFGPETLDVPISLFARGSPLTGDYLVRYDLGYLSWSPKATFEAGYVAIGLDASPAALWKATREEWVALFGADAISRLEADKGAESVDTADWVRRGMPVGGQRTMPGPDSIIHELGEQAPYDHGPGQSTDYGREKG